MRRLAASLLNDHETNDDELAESYLSYRGAWDWAGPQCAAASPNFWGSNHGPKVGVIARLGDAEDVSAVDDERRV